MHDDLEVKDGELRGGFNSGYTNSLAPRLAWGLVFIIFLACVLFLITLYFSFSWYLEHNAIYAPLPGAPKVGIDVEKQKERAENLCAGMSGQDRQTCFLQEVRRLKSTSVCRGELFFQTCIIDLAEFTKDPLLCDELRAYGGVTLRDSCILKIVVQDPKLSSCMLMQTTKNRNECLRFMANSLNDITVCNSIDDKVIFQQCVGSFTR